MKRIFIIIFVLLLLPGNLYLLYKVISREKARFVFYENINGFQDYDRDNDISLMIDFGDDIIGSFDSKKDYFDIAFSNPKIPMDFSWTSGKTNFFMLDNIMYEDFNKDGIFDARTNLKSRVELSYMILLNGKWFLCKNVERGDQTAVSMNGIHYKFSDGAWLVSK